MTSQPQADCLITVFLMAFNEADNLPTVAAEIHNVLLSLKQPFDLCILDDGSSDGTGAIADKLAAQLPGIRVIHHSENLGLGGVYRSGFRSGRGEFVTFFPADGQFPASIIGQFLPLIENRDLILGYLPRRPRSLLARFLSFSERVLYTVLFGPMPRFQGIFMIRREVLERLPLKSTGRGWTIVMELILRAARGKYRIKSAPTEIRPRMSGQSKVNNLRTIRSHLQQIAMLRRVM